MLRACCLSTDGRHLAVSYRLMTDNEPIKQAARVFDLQSGKVCVDTQHALGWPSKPANDKVLHRSDPLTIVDFGASSKTADCRA